MKRYDPNLSLLSDYLWFVLCKRIILTIYGMIQSLQRRILWFTDLSINISLLFLHEKFMLMLIYILCLQLLNFVSTKPVEAISHAYSELCLCTICLYGVYTVYITAQAWRWPPPSLSSTSTNLCLGVAICCLQASSLF